jgi:hypothetical protein
VREVGLKCVSLVSGCRQLLERCSLLRCHWLNVVLCAFHGCTITDFTGSEATFFQLGVSIRHLAG